MNTMAMERPMRRDDPNALWLSISAYARVYNLSRTTVYKLLENGDLEHRKIGLIIRIKNTPSR